MINVLVLCGGESGEHEVSLQSATSIIRYLPKELYHILPVGITKTGKWVSSSSLILDEDDPVHIRLNPDAAEVSLQNGMLDGQSVDVVFSVIHGTYGEDGCLQGFVTMHHLPFVGSGVLSSSVAMDKDFTKRLLLQGDIQCAKSMVIKASSQQRPSFEEIQNLLGIAVFVKPCSLGSSVGVSKCSNEVEFQQALQLAFQYDNKVLVEESINGREIEVSVLGDEEEILASEPGEIITSTDFYSYEAKYIDADAAKLIIPAKIKSEIADNIKATAIRVFRLLECSGMARVDFFLAENDRIVVNEINTLPGFTAISMYPKLLKHSGITYPELLQSLIQFALKRHQRENLLTRNRL